MRYTEGQLKLFVKLSAQLRSIAVEAAKHTYYAADLQRRAILAVNSQDGAETELVNEYEGVRLEGPHSLIVCKINGNVYFTDSGAFGDSMPANNRGSLFLIDMEHQSIRAIALRNLILPTGLAFSNDERVIYVSETGRNRILRFYQS
jgi:sugar lactone lactonase YvrE